MSKVEVYEYAVIRVLPKVEREEFLNVGVILYSRHKSFLDMKVHLDENRLMSFSKDLEIDLIKDYLDAWDAVCKGEAAGGAIGKMEMHLRFRWLTASRSTIIQSSHVHPGRSADPQVVLDQLFNKLVL